MPNICRSWCWRFHPVRFDLDQHTLGGMRDSRTTIAPLGWLKCVRGGNVLLCTGPKIIGIRQGGSSRKDRWFGSSWSPSPTGWGCQPPHCHWILLRNNNPLVSRTLVLATLFKLLFHIWYCLLVWSPLLCRPPPKTLQKESHLNFACLWLSSIVIVDLVEVKW